MQALSVQFPSKVLSLVHDGQYLLSGALSEIELPFNERIGCVLVAADTLSGECFLSSDAPKVTMPMKTPGYYLQPGSVPCHVDSLIPFTQRFTKNGVKLGVDQFFK